MNAIEPARFRHAISRFTTGVTVVTAIDESGDVAGMTANSFTSISLSPPTVLISLMNGRTYQAISQSGAFGVNVLPHQAAALSDHFAGRRTPGFRPKFEDAERFPKLSDAAAFFACEVKQEFAVHDHMLIVGSVVACDYSEASPLVFYSSQYHGLGSEMTG